MGPPHPPQVADELIDAVKKGLGSRLACSLPLPDYSAGEVNIYVKRLCNVQNTCFYMSRRKYCLLNTSHVVHELVHVNCVLYVVFTTCASTYQVHYTW